MTFSKNRVIIKQKGLGSGAAARIYFSMKCKAQMSGNYAASARFFIYFSDEGGAVMKRNHCLALGYHLGELPNRNVAPTMSREHK